MNGQKKLVAIVLLLALTVATAFAADKELPMEDGPITMHLGTTAAWSLAEGASKEDPSRFSFGALAIMDVLGALSAEADVQWAPMDKSAFPVKAGMFGSVVLRIGPVGVSLGYGGRQGFMPGKASGEMESAVRAAVRISFDRAMVVMSYTTDASMQALSWLKVPSRTDLEHGCIALSALYQLF